MWLKLRAVLLGCLVLAAAYMGLKAYKSIAPSTEALPEEIYADFMLQEKDAAYFLRPWDGYVAVYSGKRDKTPMSVTDIELANLRDTDKALLQKGIPAAGMGELLQLLEDLGS